MKFILARVLAVALALLVPSVALGADGKAADAGKVHAAQRAKHGAKRVKAAKSRKQPGKPKVIKKAKAPKKVKAPKASKKAAK